MRIPDVPHRKNDDARIRNPKASRPDGLLLELATNQGVLVLGHSEMASPWFLTPVFQVRVLVPQPPLRERGGIGLRAGFKIR